MKFNLLADDVISQLNKMLAADQAATTFFMELSVFCNSQISEQCDIVCSPASREWDKTQAEFSVLAFVNSLFESKNAIKVVYKGSKIIRFEKGD